MGSNLLYDASEIVPARQLGRDLDDSTAAAQQRVLVVEDDPDTVQLLKQILRIAGFDVFSAPNGKEGLVKFREMAPNLVLLDLMMAEMDGWQTLHVLREMSNVPVIIISAIGMKDEIVRALALGVDDYLTKPFHNAEVVARVHTVLRRAGAEHAVTRLVFPKIALTIDLSSHEVNYQGVFIHMTPKEFGVLLALAKRAPGIVNYEDISVAVWGQDSEDARKRTKYLVYLLRRKFNSVFAESNFIQNIDRMGYKLQSEP
jgi:DNA-binding response OmpR family regulator